jgi:hypothetical protein
VVANTIQVEKTRLLACGLKRVGASRILERTGLRPCREIDVEVSVVNVIGRGKNDCSLGAGLLLAHKVVAKHFVAVCRDDATVVVDGG